LMFEEGTGPGEDNLKKKKKMKKKKLSKKISQSQPSSSTIMNVNDLSPHLQHLFDDLCCRFIVNCPEEEYESFVRICFQIEEANWFYEDNYRSQDPTLPKFTLPNFIKIMFKYCPILQPYQDKVDDIISNFNNYRVKVPVFGAILINSQLDKCLLVKGYGVNCSWGFPKGKINLGESEVECAIREVIEETGADLNGMINEEEYIEGNIRLQKVKLFIVPFIDENMLLEPHSNHEISEIEWFLIDDIQEKKYQGMKLSTFTWPCHLLLNLKHGS